MRCHVKDDEHLKQVDTKKTYLENNVHFFNFVHIFNFLIPILYQIVFNLHPFCQLMSILPIYVHFIYFCPFSPSYLILSTQSIYVHLVNFCPFLSILSIYVYFSISVHFVNLCHFSNLCPFYLRPFYQLMSILLIFVYNFFICLHYREINLL